MTDIPAEAAKISRKIKNADTNDWVENYARIGLVSKGIVYCITGTLATMAAFNIAGGQASGKEKIFEFIYKQPYGRIMLSMIAIGLAGYVLWRFIQAIKDPDQKGTNPRGIADRIGYASSGIVYAIAAYYAGKMVTIGLIQDSSNEKELVIEKILHLPFGQWIVGGIALGFIGKGVYQVYRALTGKYKKYIKSHKLDNLSKAIYKRSGLFGYISRGIVFFILGYFFIKAAIESNPEQVEGTEGAFNFLEGSFLGAWLMGAVALGLLGYGVFMIIKGRYSKIEPSLYNN